MRIGTQHMFSLFNTPDSDYQQIRREHHDPFLGPGLKTTGLGFSSGSLFVGQDCSMTDKTWSILMKGPTLYS